MQTPIGEMRVPVFTLLPVRTKDTSGGETITYTVSDPIFVAMRAASASEQLKFDQVQANVSHVTFGHWNDLNALPADARIRLYEDETTEFDIVGLPINSAKRDWTRLNLVQREYG